MALKKKIIHNDEIDISELLKKWWSFRKKIIFGTILVSLLSTFILVLFNQTFANQKIQFTRVILQGDLGEKNNRIIAAFNSREYIQESLNILGLKLTPIDILNNLNVKKSTNPFKESLQDRIISFNNKDITKLALSSEALSSIYNSLDDNSKNIIEVEFYHLPLNMTFEQSKSLLKLMVKIVNQKILSHTNKNDINIQIIDTKNINNFLNDNERLAHFFSMINTIQSNLTTLKEEYSNVLADVDLPSYSTLADISQKMLYELSNKLGNTISVDTLNIDIDHKDRILKDLRNSLKIIDANKTVSSQIIDMTESKESNNSSTISTQIDGAVLDKILTLGSVLNLDNFRLETLAKIQNIQFERSNLIKRKDLLGLPLGNLIIQDLNISDTEERILSLSESVNLIVNQVRSFTEPKVAVEILNNPALVNLKSSNTRDLIKYVLILSVLGFLILSISSILQRSR